MRRAETLDKMGIMLDRFRHLWAFSLAVWGRVGAGHFGLIAAGVAFYAMFAVFPGLAASVAIWSLMADPGVIASYLGVAENFLPADAATLVHDQVMGLLATPRATLGWATFLTVAVALYSARAGVSALISGLEVVHRATPRSFLWGWAIDFLLTGALILALFVGLLTSISVPILLQYVTLGPFSAWLLAVLPRLAMLMLVLTCLAILYWFGPGKPTDGRRPHIFLGVLVATVAWAAVSIAFSQYLANFDSYNRVYGSIGAVAALLMWLYLSVWVVLLGGAVNAELTARQAGGKGQS